jgi:hypothetical protein
MARGTAPRHARPSGRSETAAAYQAALSELVAVRSARWNDQLEVVRLTALTEQLSAQVAALQTDLSTTVAELAALRAQPPRTVEVPVVITVPAVPEPPAAPAASVAAPAPVPAASTAREDLLLLEMAEMRRMVATQQQLLADLTVRLLDLLARFLPPAPASAPPAGAPGSGPVPPADPVLDDETATRLRVIREAFGR